MTNLFEKCVAKNCRPNHPTSFYRIPHVDAEIRQKWLENLGITEEHLNTRSRVCKRHFTNDCLAIKRVHPWAIPTLYLGKTEGLHQYKGPREREKKCCIRNCKTDKTTVFHMFPSNPELKEKWLEICRLTDNKNKNIFICQRHFRPSFYNKRLLRNAIPEFYLGLEDNDPLQEADTSDSCARLEDDELEDDQNLEDDLAVEDNNLQQKSEASDSCTRVEDIETEDNINVDDNGNCNKCEAWKTRCQKLQQEINAMRLKLNKLEQQLHEDNNDEEEHIWMLIK